MNPTNNNYSGYFSKIDKNKFPNQISYFENPYMGSNYFIFNDNNISSYLNYNNKYTSYYDNYLNNIPLNNNNNYHKYIKSPNLKRNAYTEEIKNFDFTDDYFKDYNFMPKYINDDNKKILENNNDINNNKINNKNSLYDFIFSKNNKNRRKLLYIGQNRNNFTNSKSEKNLRQINSLTDNKNNNSNSLIKINQNISPQKNSLYYEIDNNNISIEKNQRKDHYIIITKKKEILNRIIDNNKYNKIINKKEEINKIPNIPNNDNDINSQNFIYSDQKIHKRNRINIIPVPIGSKKSKDNTFEKEKNLFHGYNCEQNNKKRENSSGKKNIDINIDYDESKESKIGHNKNKSSFERKNIIYNNNEFPNNDFIIKNYKNNNNKLINKSPGIFNNLKKNKSEKKINQKIKVKTFDTDLSRRIFGDCKNRNKSPNSKSKQKNQKIKNVNINYKINHDCLSENFKIIWGGKSQAGKDSKGNIKINQDAFKVSENINNIKILTYLFYVMATVMMAIMLVNL